LEKLEQSDDEERCHPEVKPKPKDAHLVEQQQHANDNQGTAVQNGGIDSFVRVTHSDLFSSPGGLDRLRGRCDPPIAS
jgi:hypothetical protein